MGMRALVILVLLWTAVTGGCTTARPPACYATGRRPPIKPVVSSRPIIDFSKGAGGFPLSSDSLPSTPEALVESLTAGYKARVQVPETVIPVIEAGQNYPRLDALLVDLSRWADPSGVSPQHVQVGRDAG
jgi:hypothetical protein